jgi:L-alanine-DL-glutamate epimerase-like enolase superfamily enzyme
MNSSGIEQATVWHMEIPFKTPFKHALKERSTSASVVLKITLANGSEGYGEALPRDYVTGETVESVMQTLEEKLLPRLIRTKTPIQTPAQVRELVTTWLDAPETKNHLTAIGAVELALISALSAAAGQTVYEWMGMRNQNERVRYSMVLSCGNTKKLVKHTILSRLLNIKDLKLKVTANLAETHSALKIIRRLYPKANLRVDANCDWNLTQAKEHMLMLEQFDVKSVEQPLPKTDLAGLAELVAAFPKMLICADESLCSFEDAKALIQNKAATSFNIRITKNGGLFNSLRIYELAKQNGIPCQLGAQVGETSLLSLYGRSFAAIAGNLVYHEGSFGTRLLKEDIVTRPSQFGYGGMASSRITSPGLGLCIEDSLVAKHAKRCVVL